MDQVQNFEGARQVLLRGQRVCVGAAPPKSATPSLLKILSARHPSLHITLMKIFWGHLFGRFAKGGEVPSFPQLFGKNPILKEVGGIEVASVIELSEASGRVAAGLFINLPSDH